MNNLICLMVILLLNGGVCVCVCVCSVVSSSLQPSARLLCPWDFPDKNTRVGSHFLLQGIFPTQGSNLGLLHPLHWQVGSLPLCHLGIPLSGYMVSLNCVIIFSSLLELC